MRNGNGKTSSVGDGGRRKHVKSRKIANIKKDFSSDSGNIHQEVTDFVRDSLRELGVIKKLAARTVLLCEETTVQFLTQAPEGSILRCQVKRFLGDTSVILSMPGEEYDPFGFEEEDSEDAIRSILLRSAGEKYKYRNQNHVNRVRIQAGQSDQAMLYYTFAALILGLLFGLFAKFILPGAFTGGLCDNVLTPIKTIFMNSLKIIIAPIVFLSIVTCFSQFKSIGELGRLGAKVMGMYCLTTVIAICLGIGLFFLFQPGERGFALSGNIEVSEVAVDTAKVETSLVDTIVNIVPSNFVRPFVDSNTLQLIFLAIVCGIAIGKIGEFSDVLRQLLEALYSMFMTMTNIFIKLLPLAVFASMTVMIVNTGGDSVFSILQAVGVFLLAIVIMLVIYGLLVLGLGRCNPVTFYRKNREGMLMSFMTSSSSASIPINLRVCTDKMGISPKVCNFSIPLGATVNMDGNCIYYAIMGLFLARAYAVDISPSMLFSFAVTIALLSLATPGVPGAGIIMLAMVLESIHVPVESIGLIMGVSTLLGMIQTMSNTTGDVATTLIVAKSEKLLDEEVYRGSER